MSTSSLLDRKALGSGPHPSFGELLSDQERRRLAARAEQLGGEQFAADVLRWLDQHKPQHKEAGQSC